LSLAAASWVALTLASGTSWVLSLLNTMDKTSYPIVTTATVNSCTKDRLDSTLKAVAILSLTINLQDIYVNSTVKVLLVKYSQAQFDIVI